MLRSPLRPISQLRWQPPVLAADYVTWVPVQGSFGGQTLNAAGKDVLVQMPATPLVSSPGNYPAMRINSANNVVIQGGRCSTVGTTGSEFNRMGMVFSACTGIVHIEGVQLGISSETMTDAIDFYNSPLAECRLQNSEIYVRAVDPVNFTDAHPDGIFTDNVGGSPAGYTLGMLKIDRVRMDTDYQGVSLFGKGCQAYLQRLHIRITERGQAGTTQGFWQSDNTNPVVFGPDCYLEKRASQTYGLSVHPDSSDGTVARRPSVSASNAITWPLEPTITGTLQGGAPLADFVPSDRGIGYTPRASVVIGP